MLLRFSPTNVLHDIARIRIYVNRTSFLTRKQVASRVVMVVIVVSGFDGRRESVGVR